MRLIELNGSNMPDLISYPFITITIVDNMPQFINYHFLMTIPKFLMYKKKYSIFISEIKF